MPCSNCGALISLGTETTDGHKNPVVCDRCGKVHPHKRSAPPFIRRPQKNDYMNVIKRKKGIPAVIEVEGRRYQLQHKDQYKRGSKSE